MSSGLTTSTMGLCLLVTLPRDSGADLLREEASSLYERVARAHKQRVVLDCSAVEVLDSADLCEVNRIGKTLRVMGCEPVICGLSPTVAYTAVMTDTLLDAFEFVGSLEQVDGWSQ